MKSDPIPEWFNNAIVSGIELLYALALRGAPAAEVLTLTTTGWIETLWRKPLAWQQDADEQRLGAAFVSLGGAVSEWPAPAQLMQHMPPRPEPTALLLTNAVPPVSQQRMTELRSLRRRLADRLTQAPATKVSGVNADTLGSGGADVDHAVSVGGKIGAKATMATADAAGCQTSREQ